MRAVGRIEILLNAGWQPHIFAAAKTAVLFQPNPVSDPQANPLEIASGRRHRCGALSLRAPLLRWSFCCARFSPSRAVLAAQYARASITQPDAAGQRSADQLASRYEPTRYGARLAERRAAGGAVADFPLMAGSFRSSSTAAAISLLLFNSAFFFGSGHAFRSFRYL